MPTTILVPLDGSSLAEQALPYALRLARGDARLVLLRAADSFSLPGIDPTQRRAKALAEAQAYLEHVRAQLAVGGLLAESHAVYGDAAAQILEQARVLPADLVVMATHGRSGAGRVLFGSVADAVLRRANVPLVLVPLGSAASFPQERAPRILVTLDGSELAEAVLGPVAELATRLGAELILLRVVDWPPPGIYADATPWQVIDDPQAELDAARRYANGVADRLRPTVRGVRARAELGPVVSRIASVASEEHADLIAMATHGRGGLARVVLGSTATGTLERVNTPLFLVRPAAQPAPATETPAEARAQLSSR